MASFFGLFTFNSSGEEHGVHRVSFEELDRARQSISLLEDMIERDVSKEEIIFALGQTHALLSDMRELSLRAMYSGPGMNRFHEERAQRQYIYGDLKQRYNRCYKQLVNNGTLKVNNSPFSNLLM